MSDYIIRKIDEGLWLRVKARAEKDGHNLRYVLLKLLERYAAGIGLVVILALLAAGCAPRCQTQMVGWTDYDDRGVEIGRRTVPITTCRVGTP